MRPEPGAPLFARTLALAAALGLAMAGCGSGSSHGGPVVEHPGALSLVRRSAGGPDVAVLRRPLGELAWLSLWIDAGSRDGAPAQVATLAAWQAAARGGRRIEAHVEPEGTELALPCPRTELARCLRELARALATRDLADAALRAGLARLAETRRSVEAQDAARAADRLALSASWGAHAAELQPLGAKETDARATRASVATFLAAHYGPRRALLVVVGDLEEHEVVAQTARAFARNPAAQQRRVETRPFAEGSSVEVDVGDRSALTVAVAAATPEAAHAVTEALVARAEQEGAARRLELHVVRLRAQALGMARLLPLDLERAVRVLGQELAHAREGAVPEAPRVVHDARPLALARQLGARWIAQSAQPAEPALEVGLGVLVAGERADRLPLADPDEPTRERARERLHDAFEAGLAAAPPDMPGASAAGETSVTLDSGVRIELREARGDQLALAVRWSRGGLPEPPAQHGQGALLSLLTATACAGLDPSALQARLQALGARLEPLVDAGGYGIVLTAGVERWADAIDLGVSCALRPGLERRHLSAARLRLFERLGGEDGPGELRAAVAELLAPATPAVIAPWGSPARQASVSLPDLRALHAQSARPSSLRVAVVAPIARDALLAAVVRRLAGLPNSPAQSARKPAAEAPARTVLAHQSRAALAQPTLGLAVWRAAGDDEAGAHAFAALAHVALARVPGIAVPWHDAGRNGADAWAAVAVTGPPEAVAAAQAAVAALGAGLGAPNLSVAADAACAELTERAARTAATPAAQAAGLVADAPPPPPAPASPAAARALALALAQAQPTFLPMR